MKHRNLTEALFLRHSSRWVLILVATPLLLWGIERLCHHVTDGFALTRISHPLQANSNLSPPPLPSKEKEQLLSILSQPFYYLSCGGQSYVFISADRRHVIKFFKFHHRRLPGWLEHIPLPSYLDHYRSLKIARKAFRLKRTLQSYVIAYDHFKEETGLLYHHLEPTNDLHQTLLFFDRLGYRYEISLDDYAFLVQKTGLSTAEMLKKLMDQGEESLAQQKLSELLQFALRRFQKGLYDRDFKFKSNLGFIDDRPAQIDLGSLSLDPQQTLPQVYKPALHEASLRFLNWLQATHPSLVHGFDEDLRKILEE